MDTTKGAALWALRMLMLAIGGRLTAAGYGDAAFWDQAAGIAVLALTGAWSWYERRKALAKPPAVAS